MGLKKKNPDSKTHDFSLIAFKHYISVLRHGHNRELFLWDIRFIKQVSFDKIELILIMYVLKFITNEFK